MLFQLFPIMGIPVVLAEVGFGQFREILFVVCGGICLGQNLGIAS